jgi:hypothetical protein
MDPAELVKAAPELVKGAAAIGAAVPFTGIVKRMLGPAADEVAEMWRDQVRVYRYGRQVKLLEKVEKIAKDAGFTPQAVPPKILFPLLDGASFEDDETLHDMWAALLANASSPDDKPIKPIFIQALKAMTPDEARLLHFIYRRSQTDVKERYDPEGHIFHEQELRNGYSELPDKGGYASMRFQACLDALQAAVFVQRRFGTNTSASYCSMTVLGWQFVNACSPPQPKENP